MSPQAATTSPRRAAVNVDIDGLYLYDRIHGLAGGAGNADGFDAARHDARAWTRGVARFLDLFDRTGVRATFFVVAQDLDHPDAAAVFRELVAAGHEVGNHSLTHPYDLSRRPRAEMIAELAGARARLEDSAGAAVVGFRAPGYVLSPDLVEVIAETGHRYDSSRFPCPPYQAAKAVAIAAYRLLGRPSGSIPESPAVWLGRTTPYREPTRAGELVELPIGVVPGLRLPFIGTSLVAFGELGWRLTEPLLAKAAWVNFESHAIDLCDVDRDGLPAQLRAQPDQRVSLERKWPLFVRALEALARSHDVRTLAEWSALEAPKRSA
jgi:peptidoglycan/xylan/chitin deacetylase (PgdA/CDA1 family)